MMFAELATNYETAVSEKWIVSTLCWCRQSFNSDLDARFVRAVQVVGVAHVHSAISDRHSAYRQTGNTSSTYPYVVSGRDPDAIFGPVYVFRLRVPIHFAGQTQFGARGQRRGRRQYPCRHRRLSTRAGQQQP